MSLEDIYTAEWFARDFEGLQPEFDSVANGIHREFGSTYRTQWGCGAVADVGCGPGMLIARLQVLGWGVHGYDGSAHSLAMAPERVKSQIRIHDILQMPSFNPINLVICTEVAEHLDAKDAPHLVALLCSAMCPIVFTAAPPGQDGHHHVNCQPKQYWVDMFNAHGAIHDYVSSHRLRERWSGLKRLSHMTNNVMVFS